MTTHFMESSGSGVFSIAIQPDGKILAAGVVVGSTATPSQGIGIARYNPDGSLDSSFGNRGEVVSNAARYAVGLGLQGDGKIVVVGPSGGSTTAFVVARFNADGSVDTTFGTSGSVTTKFPGAPSDMPFGVDVLPDGKILAVGFQAAPGVIPPLSNPEQLDLARYNTDGRLDSAFGSGGLKQQPGGAFAGFTVQPDGKIVAAASANANMTFGPVPWFLMRLNSDGSLDSTFNSNAATIDFGDVEALNVAYQGNGRLVTAGMLSGAPGGLARVNADGSVDSTFGVNGKMRTNVTGSIAIQPDGSIIESGPTNVSANGATGLGRYLADGSVDTRFGTDGQSSVPFFVGSSGALVLQPDGGIIVAGTTNGAKGDFALERFQGGSSAPLTGTTNQRFIEQVYFDLLGRPVDAEGLSFWTTQLDQNLMSPTQVVRSIESSTEYRTVATGNLYSSLLNRAADAAGLASFVNSGDNLFQIEATILGSSEYFGRFGNDDNTFLQAVYRDVLYRSLDSAGEAHWLSEIHRGGSRASAAAGIMASAEGNADQVQLFYHQYLHRQPDSAGFQTYISLLESGKSWEDVTAIIVGSTEYFQNTGPADATFGSAGQVQTDFSGNQDFAGAVLVEPDGGLVVGGGSRPSGTSNFNFALARYDTGGNLDSAFGTGGRVLTSMGGPIFALAREPNAKIVAAGSSQGRFGLARYNPDGSLDVSFGSGGIVTTPFSSYASATSVLVQPDGKILVGGYITSQTIGFSSPTIVLARYNLDGTLDTGFGSGGTISPGFGEALALAIEPDGKFLVGEAGGSAGLERYNTDGTLDETFGIGGRVGGPGVTALLVLPNGDILAAIRGSGHFGLAEYTSSGNPDPSFNNYNSFPVEVPSSIFTPTSIALQFGGILVGGTVLASGASSNTFAVAHYYADGSVDTRFGPGGVFAASLGAMTDARFVGFQPDGKTLVTGVGGYTDADVTNANFLLARYNVVPGGLPGTANQQFVEQVYLDLLGRPLDMNGFTRWTGMLDHGLMTTTQIAQGIENSPEYRTIEVENAYSTLLGRPADPGGLASGTAFLAAGSSIDAFRAGVLTSDEYFSNAGGTNAGFVDALYRDVLLRSADVPGEHAWLAELASGTSRRTVATQFLNSMEALSVETESLYHRLLHRPADAAGLNGFVTEMINGTPVEQVQAAIAGSGEYQKLAST